jgi:hypothetical protein
MNIEPSAPTIKNPPAQFAGDVWGDFLGTPRDERTAS